MCEQRTVWECSELETREDGPQHVSFAFETVQAETFSHHEYYYKAALTLHQLPEMRRRVNFLFDIALFMDYFSLCCLSMLLLALFLSPLSFYQLSKFPCVVNACFLWFRFLYLNVYLFPGTYPHIPGIIRPPSRSHTHTPSHCLPVTL